MGGSGKHWAALEGSAGFARFCEALRSFDRLREALGCFVKFDRLWRALTCFGRLWLWKALGSFSKALGDFGRLWLQHSMSLTEALGGKLWEALGGFGRLWYASGGFGRV